MSDASATDAVRWIEAPVYLRFRIGEKTLFSARFPFQVAETHFTRLTTDLDGPAPEESAERSRAAGYLVRSHPIAERLERVTRIGEHLRYVPAQYERFFVDCVGSFESYLKAFSSKSRSTLTRKVRKYVEAAGGALDWREFREPARMAEFYGLAREVSRLTYQERLLDAGIPETEAFQREMMDLAAAGRVLGAILFFEGRPAAYVYCPIVADGIAVYKYVGFDPTLSKWSPGTVLQYVLLERLFPDPAVRLFDFTEGEGPQKRFFSTGSVLCADVYHFRRTLSNRLWIRGHGAWEATFDGLTKLAEWIGVKRFLKRAMRRGARAPAPSTSDDAS